MYAEAEQRRNNLGGAVFAIILIALMFYLTFAALQGEHGLFSLIRIEAQAAKLQSELNALQSERATIANKVARMSTDYLDLDLLDEQARKILGLGRSDEIIIR